LRLVSTVSVFQVNSSRPIVASRRIARRWDSAAARPVLPTGMTDGSSVGFGASNKMRRAHLPSRKPCRLASTPDQDALGAPASCDISHVRRR
jgi:hypothetical protein